MLTKVKYLRDSRLWDIEIPYELFGYPVYDSGRITNCEYVTFDNVPVKDVRDIVSPFDLESAGFTYIKHHSTCPLLAEHFEKVGSDLSNNSVVAAYLEETMSLVERQLSAEKVICFDWRVRLSKLLESHNTDESKFSLEGAAPPQTTRSKTIMLKRYDSSFSLLGTWSIVVSTSSADNIIALIKSVGLRLFAYWRSR